MDTASHDFITLLADLPHAISVTLAWPNLNHTNKMVDVEMTASARPVMLSPTR
jgi:hypothetical protein